MKELFIFDESKTTGLNTSGGGSSTGLNAQFTFQELLLAGLSIIVISQVITLLICKLLGVDIDDDILKQQDKTIKKWKDSNVSFPIILSSEILGSVIYSSFAEEFMFKFLLMKKLLIETFNINKWVSCILQSLLFSITHYINILTVKQNYKYTILQMISSFVSGVVGGVFYIYFNNLIPSIFAHMFNNSMVIIEDSITYLK